MSVTTEPRMPPDAAHLPWQILWLFVLGIPVGCIAWTVTHEEVFREPREYCQKRSQKCRAVWQRKFFYLFTCEYCFSHYVAALFIALTGFKLLMDTWLGYVLAFFALVWVANFYVSLYNRLRVEITYEKAEAQARQQEIAIREKQIQRIESLQDKK